jgi:hypothetical protein
MLSCSSKLLSAQTLFAEGIWGPLAERSGDGALDFSTAEKIYSQVPQKEVEMLTARGPTRVDRLNLQSV